MTFDEKVELIYDSYMRTLDYEIACLRAQLSEKEREKADQHEGLQLRMKLFDAEVDEELISNMRDLTKSRTESIRLSATIKLGQMVYSKRFGKNDNDEDNNKPRPTTINLIGVKPN